MHHMHERPEAGEVMAPLLKRDRRTLTGFSRWLNAQREREDPIGDLARDADRAAYWPHDVTDLDRARSLIRCHGACSEAVEALEAAWREYDPQEMRNRDTDRYIDALYDHAEDVTPEEVDAITAELFRDDTP